MKVRSKVGTYDDIVQFEFVRLAPVGALDVLDEDLHLNGEYELFYKGIAITHLGMLVDSRQITIVLGRDMLTSESLRNKPGLTGKHAFAVLIFASWKATARPQYKHLTAKPIVFVHYHGIARGSDVVVCIAQRLSGSPSGALYRIALVRSER
jgi:hypothetical protein